MGSTTVFCASLEYMSLIASRRRNECQWTIFVSLHARESKTVLDSGSSPWIPDWKNWISDSLFVELVFWIQMVSGTPDSFSCVPDSVAKDSGLHNS